MGDLAGTRTHVTPPAGRPLECLSAMVRVFCFAAIIPSYKYNMLFKPTYLYIKTHNITGLKYFGKTTKDPYKYNGSGKYWIKHLRKHGNDVATEVLGYFNSESECKSVAIKFSTENNIVESKSWANLCPESGVDGGYRPNNHLKLLNKIPRTQSWNDNISKANSGKRTVHKPIKVGDLTFDAMVDAAKHFNMSEGAIYYWIKIGKANLIIP